MSKSEGNIFQLSEALDRYGREAVVAYLISGHYRQPLAFGPEQMEQAVAQVERLRNFFREHPVGESGEVPPEQQRGGSGGASPDPSALVEAFRDALADDFNTPRAMAEVFELVAEANRERGSRGAPRRCAEMLDARRARAPLPSRMRVLRPTRRLRSCWPSGRRRGRRRTSSGRMRSATGWPSWAGRCGTRPRAPRLGAEGLSSRLMANQIDLRPTAGRGGGAGEAAGAPGLAGAGDVGRGAGAALRVARPPGRRRRGRSLSLRRRRRAAAAGGRAARRPRPGPGPAQPRRRLPLGRGRRRRRGRRSPSAARPR